MSIKTIPTTVAALRTHGVPSFVVSPQMSDWPGARVHGTYPSYGFRLSADLPNPTKARDVRVATKQDRPPRGVPR